MASLNGQIVFVEDIDPAKKNGGLHEQFAIADYSTFYTAARGQAPVIIDNIESQKGLTEAERQYFQRFETRSLVIIPLIIRRHVIYLVSIEGRQPGRFSQQTSSLFQIICNQATIAIENIQQVERTATALAGAQSLYRAGRILASTTTLKATSEEALIEFLYSMNLDQGGITLITPDREYGQLMAYCENYELRDVKSLTFPIDESLPYQQILLSGQPFASADAPNDPRLVDFKSFNKETFPKSLLQAPLIIKGETKGLLNRILKE